MPITSMLLQQRNLEERRSYGKLQQGDVTWRRKETRAMQALSALPLPRDLVQSILHRRIVDSKLTSARLSTARTSARDACSPQHRQGRAIPGPWPRQGYARMQP